MEDSPRRFVWFCADFELLCSNKLRERLKFFLIWFQQIIFKIDRLSNHTNDFHILYIKSHAVKIMYSIIIILTLHLICININGYGNNQSSNFRIVNKFTQFWLLQNVEFANFTNISSSCGKTYKLVTSLFHRLLNFYLYTISQLFFAIYSLSKSFYFF